jgi:hypothetical protein
MLYEDTRRSHDRKWSKAPSGLRQSPMQANGEPVGSPLIRGGERKGIRTDLETSTGCNQQHLDTLVLSAQLAVLRIGAESHSNVSLHLAILRTTVINRGQMNRDHGGMSTTNGGPRLSTAMIVESMKREGDERAAQISLLLVVLSGATVLRADDGLLGI